MKKYVLFPAFAIILAFAFASCDNMAKSLSDKYPSDLEITGMRGSVKKVTSYEVQAIQGDTALLVDEYDSDGNRTLTTQSSGNLKVRLENSFSDGNLTSIKQYNAMGKAAPLHIALERIMTYNADGLLEKEVEKDYRYVDITGKSTIFEEITSLYRYKDGQLDSISYSSRNGDVMLVKNEVLDKNNSTRQTVVYTTGIFGQRDNYYQTLIYDEKHRIVEMQSPGSVKKTVFDDKGDIAEMSFTYDGRTTKYVMENDDFDDNGNWLSQKKYTIESDGTKKLESITTRTIEYWK